MKRFLRYADDLIVLVGIALVASGVGIVHPSLALIWTGAALIAAVALGRR